MNSVTSGTTAAIYPDGIHGAIAAGLSPNGDLNIRTATLDEPEHGLTEEVLAETDVLLWWGHIAHGEVDDEIVDRVHDRIMNGMGLVVLHSGHLSKIFKKLMGTSCWLKWREADERERIWVVDPAHPIAAGLGEYFELEKCEMYGGALRHPGPGRTGVRQLVPGRRSIPVRLRFSPRGGQDFLFPARPRDPADLLRPERASCNCQRGLITWPRRAARYPPTATPCR